VRILQPGELVVKRVRWSIHSRRIGLLLGKKNNEWLVMWNTLEESGEIQFETHIDDALLVIDEHTSSKIGERCLHLPTK
jgi:hypothetical protein